MRPSLSCDVMSSNSGDMFSQMRIGLQFERCMRNDLFNARNPMPDALDLTVRDALRWGTANGAHAMGLEDADRLAHARQAGRRDRDRRTPAEHGADGRPGGLPGGAGQPVERRATCWWRAASPSATASWWAWTWTVPCSWRRRPRSACSGTRRRRRDAAAAGARGLRRHAEHGRRGQPRAGLGHRAKLGSSHVDRPDRPRRASTSAASPSGSCRRRSSRRPSRCSGARRRSRRCRRSRTRWP